MTSLTMPDSIAAQMYDRTSNVPLYDSTGRLLGTFVPVLEDDREAHANFKSPITDEEFQRRIDEPGGKGLAEIWKELDAR